MYIRLVIILLLITERKHFNCLIMELNFTKPLKIDIKITRISQRYLSIIRSCLPNASAWIKERRANLTAPLNDTETEIYGQSTNGAGDRSTAGRIDALTAGHYYYRGQIYASFSIIPRPTLLFYYSYFASHGRGTHTYSRWP